MTGFDDGIKRPHSVTLHRALLACGETCFSPKDILQDHDASIVSIQQLCAKVVANCDVDTRNALLSNVFLSGQVPSPFPPSLCPLIVCG